jgi:hypothetical protein
VVVWWSATLKANTGKQKTVEVDPPQMLQQIPALEHLHMHMTAAGTNWWAENLLGFLL